MGVLEKGGRGKGGGGRGWEGREYEIMVLKCSVFLLFFTYLVGPYVYRERGGRGEEL